LIQIKADACSGGTFTQVSPQSLESAFGFSVQVGNLK